MQKPLYRKSYPFSYNRVNTPFQIQTDFDEVVDFVVIVDRHKLLRITEWWATPTLQLITE
jgi:hypothetical protein